MSKATDILETITDKTVPFSNDKVLEAFTAKLDELSIEDITIDSAEVQVDGSVHVRLFNEEDELMDLVFASTPFPFVAVIGEVAPLVIALDGNNAPIVETTFEQYLDMTKLDWLDEDTMDMILDAENAHIAISEGITSITEDELDEVTAKKKIRIRKGGTERVKIFKCPPGFKKVEAGGKKCERIKSGEHRAASRKAVKVQRKLKSKKASIGRKRKRSLKRRQASGIR